jgi:hypothetical protein
MTDEFIERRIVTGLIISTQYLRQIRAIWNPAFLESDTAKRIASWCIEHFDQYGKAPNKDIELIFNRKSKGLKQEYVEDIEDIIDGLSDEYQREDKFNVDYLLDQTYDYFDQQNLADFTENIQNDLDEGRISDAKNKATNFKPVATYSSDVIDLSDPQVFHDIDKAFEQAANPIVKYPRQLGKFWNKQLVRDSFVALMGQEKVGKTYWLLDFAIRATRQKANVVFFQAGDMSKGQQLRRIGMYLTKRSDDPDYCGAMYQPVRDCIYNQVDECDKDEREGDDELWEATEGYDERLRTQITKKELLEKYKECPDHKPCTGCPEYWEKQNKWGCVWLQKVEVPKALTSHDTKKAFNEFFIRKNKRLKLATYPNDTLTISEIKAKLDIWEKQEQFVPDVIIIDYADILASEIYGDQRDRDNDNWKKLRGLSQEKHCLVISATQSDADSYNRNRLGRSNFSEDKRKLAHVTAMFGLNQDKYWREKEIGIMRINKIVMREGNFAETDEVHVLQNLSRGQPCLGSYW